MWNFIICEDDIEMQKAYSKLLKIVSAILLMNLCFIFYTDYSSSLKDRIPFCSTLDLYH